MQYQCSRMPVARTSMATPVFWMLSPMYQLMKLDLPAEWLPTIITLIFLRGLRSVMRSSGLSAMACDRLGVPA